MNKFDEIREYKSLLDNGIITEQEFQLKKQSLLGVSSEMKKTGEESDEPKHRKHNPNELNKKNNENNFMPGKRMKGRKKYVAVCIAIVLLVSVAIGIVLASRINKESKYNQAVDLFQNGSYLNALNVFTDISDYKDSSDFISKIYESPKYWKQAPEKSIIHLGTYTQNMEGKLDEDINWRVIKKEKDRALLISEKALSCVQYNKEQTSAYWSESYLRDWLNDSFYNEAFSDREKEYITKCKEYDGISEYVTLLSKEEASEFFESDVDRKCQATTYCIEQGAEIDNNENCDWWLKTQTEGDEYQLIESTDILAPIVDKKGCAGEGGVCASCVDDITIAVRPVIWICFNDENTKKDNTNKPVAENTEKNNSTKGIVGKWIVPNSGMEPLYINADNTFYVLDSNGIKVSSGTWTMRGDTIKIQYDGGAESYTYDSKNKRMWLSGSKSGIQDWVKVD